MIFFVSKASVQGSDDPVPLLEPITSISSALSSINTSPIEVSKVLRQLKKSNFSHCGISGRFINIMQHLYLLVYQECLTIVLK